MHPEYKMRLDMVAKLEDLDRQVEMTDHNNRDLQRKAAILALRKVKDARSKLVFSGNRPPAGMSGATVALDNTETFIERFLDPKSGLSWAGYKGQLDTVTKALKGMKRSQPEIYASCVSALAGSEMLATQGGVNVYKFSSEMLELLDDLLFRAPGTVPSEEKVKAGYKPLDPEVEGAFDGFLVDLEESLERNPADEIDERKFIYGQMKSLLHRAPKEQMKLDWNA